MNEYLFKQYYEFIELMGVSRPRQKTKTHARVDSYWTENTDFLFKRKSLGTNAAADAVNDFQKYPTTSLHHLTKIKNSG